MENDFLIDTHCHLHDHQWFTSEQQVEFLKAAHQARVREIICIGTNHQDSLNAQEYAARHEGVYWTYGVHPEFAGQEDFPKKLLTNNKACANIEAETEPKDSRTNFDDLNLGEILQNAPKLVAIGEIGLDYHYEPYNRASQIKLFEEMLQLALDLNLPVSLHIREAFTDALAVLDNFPDVRGVVHSFTGSKKALKQVLERDFYVGVNGLITYNTIALPPLERIVLETDAPFLTPVPFRGTINSPRYVKTIATYLAEKLGEAEYKIAEQTTKNARTVFKI